MPPWFMDIESATDTDAKSNGTPPASRTAAQASRANSPSSALQGVTRPSVEATPTNGLARSASDKPSACRNARCGALSSPSTVTRDGRIGMVFFVFIDDFPDVPAGGEAELRRALGARFLRRAIHHFLHRRVGLEAHLARAARGVEHLLRRDGDAVQQDGSLRTHLLGVDTKGVMEGLRHLPVRDAG